MIGFTRIQIYLNSTESNSKAIRNHFSEASNTHETFKNFLILIELLVTCFEVHSTTASQREKKGSGKSNRELPWESNAPETLKKFEVLHTGLLFS